MFLIQFFKYSLSPKTLIQHSHQKLWKAIIYFLLVSLITIFPLNFLIVQENGWSLNFIEANLTENTPNWVLPEDMRIYANRLDAPDDNHYIFEHDGMTYIFNASGEEEITGKTVSFFEDKIMYSDGEGHEMYAYDYKGFYDEVNFRALNLAIGSEKADLYRDFASMIESSFGSYIVFYTLSVNTIVNISVGALFIFLLSLIMQLFRFGYSKFFSYKDSLVFVILSMGIPSVLSFIIGFVAPSLAPVIYQFGIGVVVMAVMIKYGKRSFS